MGKKRNVEAVIQISILLGIAVLLFYSMISKKINDYVHPRFFPGIWLSILVLLLFAVSQISNIKKARHNESLSRYILFLIPLAAAIIFPANGVKNAELIIANGNRQETIGVTENQEVEDEDVLDVTEEIVEEEMLAGDDISEKYAKYEVDGVTIIQDDIFAEWFTDTYNSLDFFLGKRYQLLAQVYTVDGFAENQFLAGRYFMVCCAADMVVYGVACESDIRSQLTDEEWITVTGTMSQCDYEGETVPMLTDITIEKAEAPEEEYIYYSYY
ncbi:TIGR03943 family putative permease subunit [Anaeromicropila populeti]|uniref:Putative membrane protein n=1 Tax=Anaeromicropila populeti TaxID=37658 RepID=A0A1I6LPL8_9FIRM|nr:TIGR03943 family protein [Anaeromicropila populeti]SFS05358.1 putative membrane protein [Anaeromicropila populeti]